jgi:superfamily II DNA or RNA helicase
MEIEVGILKSRLVTDNPSILEGLYNKYGFKVDGYQYTPQYKRKVWDGKKRYFKRNGEFRTGLLERIEADLREIGVQGNIRRGEPVVVDEIGYTISDVQKYSYRDYQKEAVEHCLNVKRCIVKSPVASGKTLIMAGLIASLRAYSDCKIVVLFREKAILNQTYKFFQSCGIKGLGVNSGEGYIYGDVMLSTVQSIEKILGTHLDHSFALIIDEAHQFCKGESTVAAIEAFPNAIFRVAFTATVPADIHGLLTLEGAFGPVIETRSVEDLIKDGSLAKPIIQIIECRPTLEEKDEDLSYIELYDKFIVNSEHRNNLIKKCYGHITSSNKTSKTLILCKNLEHVVNLKKLIPNSHSVEGKDSLEDRYKAIELFLKDPSHSVLIGTNVLQTGININEITHMINARGMEGEIPTIQGIGRGLRTTKEKTEMYFYDFYDFVPYLKDHSKSRISHYENLKFDITYVQL